MGTHEVSAKYRTFERTAREQLEDKDPTSVTCVLCGGPLKEREDGLFDTRFGIEGKYDIRSCQDCRLEQLFPSPNPEALKALYESHYNFGGESDTFYTSLRERFLFSLLYRLWIRLDGDISFHLRHGSGRLLDVGCNEGRGLKIYASNGFHVEGLELNEKAAAVARKAGFTVHTALLEQFNPEIGYDVVVLSNVLEHSLNPRQMLFDVHRVLATNGQVWISCPNSQSWLRALFGRSWINWHVPFHISHFNADILRRLLKEERYVDLEIQQISPALWVTQSIISYLFSKEGKKTLQLRNPFLTLALMVFARLVLFPALWVGNKLEHGDCLLAVGAKVQGCES
jgi:2-polyprenyl-3-methyl-5-hydroxy-6-metoxy-1,4-benzoquinol methylase